MFSDSSDQIRRDPEARLRPQAPSEKKQRSDNSNYGSAWVDEDMEKALAACEVLKRSGGYTLISEC